MRIRQSIERYIEISFTPDQTEIIRVAHRIINDLSDYHDDAVDEFRLTQQRIAYKVPRSERDYCQTYNVFIDQPEFVHAVYQKMRQVTYDLDSVDTEIKEYTYGGNQDLFYFVTALYEKFKQEHPE